MNVFYAATKKKEITYTVTNQSLDKTLKGIRGM